MKNGTMDTQTAAAIMKASEDQSKLAEEAMLRVVELMQEAIEHRARIFELESTIRKAVKQANKNGMGNWKLFVDLASVAGE